MNLLGANIFTPNNAPSNFKTGIAIELDIWNTGEPSIALGWKLAATLADGTRVAGKYTKIPKVFNAEGEQTFNLIEADALDLKTRDEDVGRRPVTGQLLFYFGVEQHQLMNENTVLELTVMDAYENVFSSERRLGNW
jgi:hypothetical protein